MNIDFLTASNKWTNELPIIFIYNKRINTVYVLPQTGQFIIHIIMYIKIFIRFSIAEKYHIIIILPAFCSKYVSRRKRKKNEMIRTTNMQDERINDNHRNACTRYSIRFCCLHTYKPASLIYLPLKLYTIYI